MKKKLLFVCLVLTTVCAAQKKAVTETGEVVILYDNGTWENVEDSDTTQIIKTNSDKFIKSKNATFLLKSTRCTNIGFWIDPKKWKFEKGKMNADAEFELQLQGQDLYAMIISEKIEIPLGSLKELALENARNAAPDLIVVKEEYRTVNGLKVLMMHLDGTMKGIKISYFGYYYSSPSGSIQFITYTSQNLLKTYIKDCEELLSGLSQPK